MGRNAVGIASPGAAAFIPGAKWREPNRTEAAKLKGEGVRAGVPDLCLPVSRGGYHGLYIELKRISGGRVSPEQRKWLESLRQEGYMAVVCHGWDEARHTIESYLDGEAQYGGNKPVL